ncbi:hypothetical protein DFR74_103500 [Nocardia puris]|uniref:Uncharacterized protein n=3 Tax=Nocardia puris TaxID=208602 RepID=A0A366DRZ5_9NOCA|nr:hypothetical protein DFR74_103500 [Nocardia puris]
MIVDLFRSQPRLVAPLLDALGCPLPKFDRAESHSEETPALAVTEFHADSVVVLRAADRPVFAVVVEVQLRPDPDKPWTWPVYAATLRARLRCPTVLLVLCPDKRTADWAAEPVDFGYGSPPALLRSLVLDPRGVPLITDPEVAVRLPELTVLSVVAHPDYPDPRATFEALMAALGKIETDRGSRYYEFVFSRLPEAVRSVWESLMNADVLKNFEPQSNFAKKWRVAGEADALLRVLAARRIVVPDDVRGRIEGCEDLEQLGRWIDRAATAESVDDLFI